MIAEAGVTLQDLQETAEKAGRLFPLSISSQGSCQIGGNISTNAGGTGVIAHGNMREQVLGLEVVLPSGRNLGRASPPEKGQHRLRMKQLFIGAEGTLGIVTAAALRLRRCPRGARWRGRQSPRPLRRSIC